MRPRVFPAEDFYSESSYIGGIKIASIGRGYSPRKTQVCSGFVVRTEASMRPRVFPAEDTMMLRQVFI